MTPEDFATNLTKQLRRRGLKVLPEDTRLFMTEAGWQIIDAPDMEQWAERFIQARRLGGEDAIDSVGRVVAGAVIGLLCSPVVVVVVGAAWGAIDVPRLLNNTSMAQGAYLGVIFLGWLLGIPIAVASVIVGALVGALLERRKSDPAS